MHLTCKIVCGRSYSGFNFKSFGIALDRWLLAIASYNVAVMQTTLQKKTYLLPISRAVARVAQQHYEQFVEEVLCFREAITYGCQAT